MHRHQKAMRRLEKQWDKLDFEEREKAVFHAMIELACDDTLSEQAHLNIHRLVMRLDDYEAMIRTQHDLIATLVEDDDEPED